MKIAILVPNFVKFDGGARVAEIQAEELAQAGNYVAVFALAADMKPKDADVFVMGMPKSLLRQRIYRLLFPLDLFRIVKWLPKLKNFDLIIAHFYPLTLLGYLAKKFYNVKYTFWYNGIMDPQFFPHLHERIYLRLQILLTRFTVKNADCAVAASKFGQKELKRYTGLDSKVVYNKVNLERFHPGIRGTEIRERYNLGDDPVILFVGALRPVKGVHLLLKAFNLVKERIPKARLVIVGNSDYPYYFRELKSLSDDSVIFAGFVSYEFLPLYYGMCDVYCTCSRWEIHNLPVLEVQTCGKPVIAFDIEPFREEVDENGVLVEPENVEEFAHACIEKLRQVRGI